MVKVRDGNLGKKTPRIIQNYGCELPVPKGSFSPIQANLQLYSKANSEELLSLQTCTKVIASIQILFSIFMLSLVGVLGDEVIHAYIADEWKVNTLETASVIGVLLGSFLFLGAHFGWPSMLLLWMFGTGMGLTLLLFIRGVIVSGLLIKGGINWVYLLHFIPPICICGILAFSLQAVSLYRNQLINQNLVHNFKMKQLLGKPQGEPKIFDSSKIPPPTVTPPTTTSTTPPPPTTAPGLTQRGLTGKNISRVTG